MLVLSSYPSVIPILQAEWRLSNAQAGSINGLFFAGNVVSVAIVTSLTDRFDAKRLYLVFLALGGFAALSFAFLAADFFTAATLRCLEGVALGGTYMPGLRILTDNVPESHRSRATSFYTACFFLAAGLSFFLALELVGAVGWRWTIAVCGMGPVLALFLAIVRVPRPSRSAAPAARLFDLRPVLANRRALGFSFLYGIHNVEVTTLGSWLVPFLVFSQGLGTSGEDGTASLATVAALVSIIALPASILGNEMAHKIGRQAWIIVVALGSAATGVMFGLSASLGPAFVIVLAFCFSITIAADSSAITGGMLHTADPRRKGATMALYSIIGFSGAALGPALFGFVLDLAGGEQMHSAWVAAFGVIAALVLIQPVIVWRLVGGPLIRA